MYRLIVASLLTHSVYASQFISPDKCPPNAYRTIMFIDSCPVENADYITTYFNRPCTQKEHAEKVIKTYREFGGQKGVWLWTYMQNSNTPSDKGEAVIKGIEAALFCGVRTINFSGGGSDYSRAENEAVQLYLHFGGVFVAAAGNERSNIDRNDRIKKRKELESIKGTVPHVKNQKDVEDILDTFYRPFYPASYKGVIAVGAISCSTTDGNYSNYGSKVIYEMGCDKNKTIIGSSLAAPRYTAKLEVMKREEEKRRIDADHRRKIKWKKRCRELKANFCNI